MSGEDDLLAMEAVVRAVERAQAVPSHRRSAAFLQLTRMAKAAKKQGQMREKASERISRLILRCNAEFAKTDSDVIDLAAKGYKSNGKGKHTKFGCLGLCSGPVGGTGRTNCRFPNVCERSVRLPVRSAREALLPSQLCLVAENGLVI